MNKRTMLGWVAVLALLGFLFSSVRQGEGLSGSSVSPLQPSLMLAKAKATVVSGGTYRFIAFGDWGAGTPFQRDVAAQVNSLYEKTPFDAALLLGDNIYPVGDIKKFGKVYFTDMYAPLIRGGVNFIVALGNHDEHEGHEKDQLAFFRMPGYYYVVSKPKIDFFVLDTNTFAKDQVQQKWLSKALAQSRAEWKIVLAHHPLYSSGEHGQNIPLQKVLEPILVKNHVDLYLAGHDHDYERFAPIQGVQHVVSGGGGAYLRRFEKPLPGSLVRVQANHFLKFELKNGDLKMWAVDKTGKVIDQAEWSKELQRGKLAT